MIDKDKLKSKIEGLKSNLIHGACSSQIAMETSCKEEAYNEVLSILDSLQGEPSKFDAAIQEGDDVRYNEDLGCRVNLSQLKRVAKKEEPVSKDLEKAAKEWDAKASFTPFYMALDDKGNPYEVRQDYTTHAESFKAGAKWQREQMMKNAVNGLVYAQLTTSGEIMIRSNYFKSETLNYLDNVKLIIIKEDKV